MKRKMVCRIALMLVVVFGLVGFNFAKNLEPPKDMVLVPEGSFVMGIPSDDGMYSGSAMPAHVVYVSDFYMDKYEVTKLLWFEVYDWAIMQGYTFDGPSRWGEDTGPISDIIWYDAVKWCNARSEMCGIIPSYYVDSSKRVVYRGGRIDINNDCVRWDTGYRLPTEAEWEKGARGGLEGKRFPWGDTISTLQAKYIPTHLYSYDLGGKVLNPGSNKVGLYPPNGYGIYDMAGRDWEWCWDWYEMYSSEAQSDPRGPSSKKYAKIMRGGSGGNDAYTCRVFYRQSDRPDPRYTGPGFRTVISTDYNCWVCDFANVPVPELEEYYCPIIRKPGKDCLIIVTHGWMKTEEGETRPYDPEWVDKIVDAIKNDLFEQGSDNWQVESWKWIEKAWFYLPRKQVLDNGENEGMRLGKYISLQGWKHVHLIAHSAGSALIQAVCNQIKSRSVSTTVHTTFLDPYVGFWYFGRSKYGKGADWSDNYFSFDSETFDDYVGRTSGKISHAYNIEVTWTDPTRMVLNTYQSSSGEIIECHQTLTSHGWPHDFYLRTIIEPKWGDAEGFGYSLSKEGGNWELAKTTYGNYNDPIKVLGIPDSLCIPEYLLIPEIDANNLKLNESLVMPSSGGSVQNSIQEVILSASKVESGLKLVENINLGIGTPAWLGVYTIVTNSINSVSFDVNFTSVTNSTGLLSVYYGSNCIGSVDERFILPGYNHYTFSFPETITNAFVLGFRLDAFSTEISAVTVDNIALNFEKKEPETTLSVTGYVNNGLPVFKMTSMSGCSYILESSSNLTDWASIALLINTNGTVNFVDRSSVGDKRFYRAVRK